MMGDVLDDGGDVWDDGMMSGMMGEDVWDDGGMSGMMGGCLG